MEQHAHGRWLRARLRGRIRNGAVGAGYHDGSAPGSSPAAPCTPLTPGAEPARRGHEAFMRAVGRNPVGARIHTLQRGSGASRTLTRVFVGVVTDCGRSAPMEWWRPSSIVRRPRRSSIRRGRVRVAGDASPLAPRVAALARQVDARLHLRISSPSTSRGTGAHAEGGRHVVFGSVLRSGSSLHRGGSGTRSSPSPWRVAPATSEWVSPLGATPGTCSASRSPRRSSARRRHHRRRQPRPAPRVARRQADRDLPRIVSDARPSSWRPSACACVRRTGAPSARLQRPGAATELTSEIARPRTPE